VKVVDKADKTLGKNNEKLKRQLQEERALGKPLELKMLDKCLFFHLTEGKETYGRLITAKAPNFKANALVKLAGFRDIMEHEMVGINSVVSMENHLLVASPKPTSADGNSMSASDSSSAASYPIKAEKFHADKSALPAIAKQLPANAADSPASQPETRTLHDFANLVLSEVRKVLKVLPTTEESDNKLLACLEERNDMLSKIKEVAPSVTAVVCLEMDDAPYQGARIAINRNQSVRLKGRDKELDSLKKYLIEEKALVLVHGVSGSGKSMLADAALHHVQLLKSFAASHFHRARASSEAGAGISCAFLCKNCSYHLYSLLHFSYYSNRF
jgi:SpoVK/Ycf46/Vps4 family AAA+-type ATPase